MRPSGADHAMANRFAVTTTPASAGAMKTSRRWAGGIGGTTTCGQRSSSWRFEDGADPDVLETRVTHTRKARNAFDGYNRACTGIGRAARSRSFGSRADREARRSSNRSRPEAAAIRCSSLQSSQP
jgi:hypothetical protein